MSAAEGRAGRAGSADWVRFTKQDVDEAQIKWGNHRDPRGVLEAGRAYEVARVEEHSWHTRIYLVGVDGYFNSVWFEAAS